MKTLTITLGHNGLTTDTAQARFLITDALTGAGAEILATFHDGTGTWEADDGETICETCDAWVASVPTDVIRDLQVLLSAYAATFGQEALGCVIHDDAYGPSYCGAEQ